MNTELVAPVVRSHTRAYLHAFIALFKLRVVALLLFAGTGGAFLAAGGWPGLEPLALMTLTGGLAAMGASALNEYLERDTDARMRRTRQRPLVNGAIRRSGWVPVVALALIWLPSLAVLPFNPALTLFSLGGAFIYVGIYTLWLKPRTVWNIVIGGLAGSCAVLSGGAAAGNWLSPGVIGLGLLVFVWTPTHFWSLALMCREDYARAGVPMLPVRVSPQQSALWVTLHAVATGCAALGLGIVAPLGWVYWLPLVGITGSLLRHCARLLADPSPERARALFLASNAFLALLLVLICLDLVI